MSVCLFAFRFVALAAAAIGLGCLLTVAFAMGSLASGGWWHPPESYGTTWGTVLADVGRDLLSWPRLALGVLVTVWVTAVALSAYDTWSSWLSWPYAVVAFGLPLVLGQRSYRRRRWPDGNPDLS